MGSRKLLTTLLVLAVLFGLGGWLARSHFREGLGLPLSDRSCQVDAGKVVRLDPEQMANAATIAAVGIRRNVPAKAVVIALATALQESKLRNLPHLGERNDHDSIGLFQQRPSQGWGKSDRITDPRYAAGRFYSALLKVDGWQSMRVTDAAQRVQRSAYPDHYQKWADEAEALAAAFTGEIARSVSCSGALPPERTGADALAELIRLDFGSKANSAVVQAGSLRLTARDAKAGWQFAHWLVAQAEANGVTRVTFSDQQWSAESGKWSAAGKPTDQVVAEVRSGK